MTIEEGVFPLKAESEDMALPDPLQRFDVISDGTNFAEETTDWEQDRQFPTTPAKLLSPIYHFTKNEANP